MQWISYMQTFSYLNQSVRRVQIDDKDWYIGADCLQLAYGRSSGGLGQIYRELPSADVRKISGRELRSRAGGEPIGSGHSRRLLTRRGVAFLLAKSHWPAQHDFLAQLDAWVPPPEPERAPTIHITSDFAILDVKAGRTELAEHFADRPRLGLCPHALRIPITIMELAGAFQGFQRWPPVW